MHEENFSLKMESREMSEFKGQAGESLGGEHHSWPPTPWALRCDNQISGKEYDTKMTDYESLMASDTDECGKIIKCQL